MIDFIGCTRNPFVSEPGKVADLLRKHGATRESLLSALTSIRGTQRVTDEMKAKVLKHGRGEKVRIFKLNRRKHYRRSQGHRQNYTEIEILGIAA